MKRKFIFFYADWDNLPYSKCNQFKSECKRLGATYEIIDAESEIGVALSIKYGIRNVPAIVVLENKKVIGIEKGNNAYQNIVSYLPKY